MKMFRNHVVKQLSAYCNGQLSNERSREIADHLLKCRRCRREYDEIKFGVQLAENLPLVEAPADLWNDIEAALRPGSLTTAPRPTRVPFLSVFSLLSPAGYSLAALVIIAIIAGGVWYLKRTRPVEQTAGQSPPALTPETKDVALAEGESLETDGSTRARFNVGPIGQVEVEPNTRITMVNSQPDEYRLDLARGMMSARVNAPPRLFFVNTPSAEAVDLGCAYTLEVDDAGGSLLRVTWGQVALAFGGREVYVPLGAACRTRPNIGPGTPYFEDASQELIAALRKYDFENGGDEAVGIVLEKSRDKDTFTLWHLLPRVNDDQRRLVLDRMIKLVGLPKGVTQKGIMKLNQKMLDDWKDALDIVWFQ
jgi:putative zinc finger protein